MRLLSLLCAAVLMAGTAAAQPAPPRPIRLIVPFPPGNAADLTARILAEEVQQRLGQTLVVENRAGASGAIGVQAVARAAPDGTTLLLSSLSPLVVNPALVRNLPYDPVKDLAPISLIGRTGFIFVVAPDFAARTMQEAVSLLRAQPGRTIAANPGTGTVSHLALELFMLRTGTRMDSVPYRGSAQALLDLGTGRVQVMIDAMTSALPQVQGGRARALAVLAAERSALAPDVPSMAEAGLPGIEAMAWTGLLGPAGTPAEVVQHWSQAINRLLTEPAVQARFAQQNLELYPPGTPEGFATLIAADLAKWTRVVTDARIEVQP